MTLRPHRIGLVGAGRLAELGHLPALAAVPQLRLTAVADPDGGRATALAAAAGPGVAAHANVHDLLAAGAVDALIVASPVEHHAEAAAAAAAAGLPALVEKPPAADAAGARQLAALAPAPWIGFNRRFDPGVRALRRRVPDRGPVELDLGLAYRRRSWAPHSVADDVLLDLGPHVVDLVQWLTRDRITGVSAEATPSRASLQLVGERVVASATLATDALHRESVVVRAGGGRPASHRVGGPVGLVTGRVAARVGRPHPLVASLAAELQIFAAALAGRPSPDLATAADGVAVMAVLDAARRSAAGGHQLEPVPQEP